MVTAGPRKLFVNLPVRDLPRTRAFWQQLGFTFNEQFSDDKSACLVINQDAYVMLLVGDRFKDFARKPVIDTTKQTGGLYALSCASRAEVDQLVKLAIEAGGSPATDKQDHGFMYTWSFFDPDGHHWELVSMDPTALHETPA